MEIVEILLMITIIAILLVTRTPKKEEKPVEIVVEKPKKENKKEKEAIEEEKKKQEKVKKAFKNLMDYDENVALGKKEE